MKRECSGLFHPRGDLGPVLRETRRATFHERICPSCGGVQGIARLPKGWEPKDLTPPVPTTTEEN